MSYNRDYRGKRGRNNAGGYKPPYRSYNRFGMTEKSGLTSTYFVLDWWNDDYIPCESVRHACSIAFGKNKSNRNQNCLACIRTKDYFVCL